ncbi:hypothetical protein EG68_06079 [Paragonimus skrjabini miyazakii]|uniref:Uncharacterized protein n=1 Tax=Paragonimus skrjabini miyazakii TaxID=59628 RepID=A0A8S9YT29_9TREM|nr:hypothetical protein EG68_06079 [Paragonimus skrjabini miyazakii]
MTTYRSLIFGLLILTGTFITVLSLQCYECTNCATISTTTSKSATECAQCAKHELYVESVGGIVSRKCYENKTCVPSDWNLDIKMRILCCDSQLCNSRLTNRPIWSTLAVLLFTLFR